MKISSASWTSVLRETRSASLPQIGVLTVVASRVEVTTQVKDDWPPPRSLMMRGSDVETTVLERIATSIPSSSPERAVTTSRWLISPGLLIGRPPRAPGRRRG